MNLSDPEAMLYQENKVNTMAADALAICTGINSYSIDWER